MLAGMRPVADFAERGGRRGCKGLFGMAVGEDAIGGTRQRGGYTATTVVDLKSKGREGDEVFRGRWEEETPIKYTIPHTPSTKPDRLIFFMPQTRLLFFFEH